MAAVVAVAGGVLLLSRRDAVAAGVALVGMASLAILAFRRGPRALRRSLLMFLTGATALAVVSAVVLAVPLRPIRPQGPLLVTPPDAPAAPAAPTSEAATVLGFVTPDYGDAGEAIDRAGPLVSSVAATGITLGRKPGTIDVLPSGDALARAHLHGAAALAVVSNYDGTTFNGERAAEVLNSASARHRLVATLVDQMDSRGWDGIVVDIERLPASSRVPFPMLIADLERAAGDRPVLVAVPARDPEQPTAEDGYDLASLGQAADQVVWMAYDQHTAATDAGPIAGLRWVRRTLTAATKVIPPQKLLLGVAGYGYAWPAQGAARDLTFSDAQALAGASGSTAEFDPVEQEWRARTADGTQAWYNDARSTAARATLAAEAHLAGIALWRIGAEDPATLSALPFPARRPTGLLPGGGAEVVRSTGVVALTFDDGPDPRFTEPILDVLRREHVPATFFAIANQAQAHPDLLRREVRDGHVVANHTYSHLDLTDMPAARAEAEILAGSAVIEGITGRKPALFRSPFGEEITTRFAGGDALAADLGMHPVRWTDDSGDWRRPGVDAIVDRVLGGASTRTIVLFHDGGGDRSQTVAALPRIIEALRARGYAFTTVDRLEADVTTPYLNRVDAGSRARGLGIIAAFRLQMALRHVLMALLALIVVVSLWRIVVGGPLCLRHRRRTKRRVRAAGGPVEAVSFTVIVPAHNEEQVIAKTLGALELVRGPGVEVIVVDDGSTDATAEIAGAFPVTVIRQPQLGKATALNTGVAAARCEVIVVLDADTVLDPDFLDTIAPHFADPEVGAVAGNIKVGNRRSILARLQALEYIVSLDIDRRTQDELGVIAVVPGAASAFRKAALIDVGGYPDDTLVEDADLTVALLRGGWRLHYEPAALAYT
ncbi:MAG: glycosyltransferase, partial [Actinobacteria bacterium]|nr:glycosyltransferase [Actinomycetota bacterium]